MDDARHFYYGLVKAGCTNKTGIQQRSKTETIEGFVLQLYRYIHWALPIYRLHGVTQ